MHLPQLWILDLDLVQSANSLYSELLFFNQVDFLNKRLFNECISSLSLQVFPKSESIEILILFSLQSAGSLMWNVRSLGQFGHALENYIYEFYVEGRVQES